MGDDDGNFRAHYPTVTIMRIDEMIIAEVHSEAENTMGLLKLEVIQSHPTTKIQTYGIGAKWLTENRGDLEITKNTYTGFLTETMITDTGENIRKFLKKNGQITSMWKPFLIMEKR